MAKKKSNIVGTIIKVFGIIFGLLFLISWIYSAFAPEIEYDYSDHDIVEYDDDYEDDTDAMKDSAGVAVQDFKDPEIDPDSIRHPDDFLVGKYYTHEHSWKDNDQNEYNGSFKVNQEYFDTCYYFREGIKNGTSYRKVYEMLAEFDADKMDELIEMYDEIKEEEKLDQKAFADMVVTSIQNIPYVLVHEYSHKLADKLWGGYIEEYHEEGGECLGRIKWGLQSPVEFMSNFKGDCDTRAVLCYLILKDFGFDVAVLGSDEYGHAVLGISGNYRGSFVKKDGIRYYAWETTAIGYRPGVMAPDWSNMDYWTVDLCSRD